MAPQLPTLFVVDDQEMFRQQMRMELADSYNVITAETGEDCLALIEQGQAPDLLILDISLPGMNGYEICRAIRKKFTVPILFVTADGSLEACILAYDAGADDLVEKPVDVNHLLHKIEKALMRHQQQRQLLAQNESISELALDFLQDLGNTGMLLNFMRTALTIEEYDALADRAVETAAEYGVSSVVQIRHDGGYVTRSRSGEATALEEAVIDRMLTMGRQFQFQRRFAVNYDTVSILVTDMPDDDFAAGRVRDNVSILAECVERVSEAVAVRKESATRAEALQVAAVNGHFLESMRELYHQQQQDTQTCLENLIERVEKTFYFLGLTDTQEEVLSESLRAGAEDVLKLFESGIELDQQFEAILETMQPKKTQANDVWL